MIQSTRIALHKVIQALKAPKARKRLILAAAGATALFVSSSPAFAWYDNAWTFRKAITVDTNAAGVTDGLKHYPVLIRLDSSQFNFPDAQKNGGDLRFVEQDDKTVLNYQIESFDPTLGLAMVWVDVPDLQGGSQHQIWMYYGNKAATGTASAGAVFDPNFRGVYHFATGAVATDSSPAHNNLTGAIKPAAAAAIGAGADLTGQSASFSMAVDPQSGFSLSFLAKENAPSANATLFALRGTSGSILAGLKQSVPYLEVGTTHVDAQIPAVADWASYAVIGQGSKVVLYVNGQAVATVNAPVPAISGTATVGADGTANPFAGQMDELRVSNVARPTAMVAADYASQKPSETMVAYGADEKASGMGFGYFGIIFRNITTDAWVVITILVMMAVISWLVMWAKYSYVAAAKRANRAFQKAYRAHHGSIVELDQALAAGKQRLIGRAPLYRLFKVGMEEIHKRGELRGRALTEEMVESIRAALDGQQVEESQAFDSNMVLLSIAIAGGPFIGLFGTVLGVMITFAAIAASGDVNVNAIAPGIAAALLATVTGLFVAIPALFGFNFIGSLNDAENDRARVFSDQFITKLAEAQREAAMAHAAE